MFSYKFYKMPAESVIRSDLACIPFDAENRDCRQFLEDWKAGATVTNADGSPAPYSEAAVRALGLEV